MGLRIMQCTSRSEQSEALEQGLSTHGHELVARISPDQDLYESIRRVQPDLLMIDVPTPTMALLARTRRLTRVHPLPIVMFAERSEPPSTRAVVAAGVDVFVVDGFAPQRLGVLIDLAIARFLDRQTLRDECHSAAVQLRECERVERAKAILMRRRNLGEGEAYRVLQQMARDQGRRIGEVAERVVLVERMLVGR